METNLIRISKHTKEELNKVMMDVMRDGGKPTYENVLLRLLKTYKKRKK